MSFLGSFALTVAIFIDSWDRFVMFGNILVQGSMTPSNGIAMVMVAFGKFVSSYVNVHIILSVLSVGFLSQTFFACRIYELSQKRWWQVLVCCVRPSVNTFN